MKLSEAPASICGNKVFKNTYDITPEVQSHILETSFCAFTLAPAAGCIVSPSGNI